jgi:hypothetical protein
MTGALYERSVAILIAAVIISQFIAPVLLIERCATIKESELNSFAEHVIRPPLRLSDWQLHLATSR